MICYSAPGRVNLIGEHTDYNLGFALPIALPQRTVAAFTPSDADALIVHSDYASATARVPLDTVPGDVTGWAAYIAGVVWALRRAGHPVVGGDMAISTAVAVGSGLGASAALECAVLGAMLEATGCPVDRLEQAKLAQAAENEYVGAPTGLLDQVASLWGEPRTAILVDFGQLSMRPVPFDPDGSGVALLVIDSHARHRHAGGEYAARRVSCERAAAALGVGSLRDIQAASELEKVRDPVDARRARHVLTENQRVLDFVAALEHCDFKLAGKVLTASHASMREDFEITTEHIDLIENTATRAGALGARMTGGGFGGCVIALVSVENIEKVSESVRRAVIENGYPEPTITRTHAGPGASPA